MKKWILALGLLWPVALFAWGKAAKNMPIKDFVEQVNGEFQGHNYEKVIQLYREFAAAQPESYVPLVARVLYSQSLADTGDIDGAIDSLRGALADLPAEVDPSQLRYDLANLLFLQKRYDEAKTDYQKLVLQASHNAEILSKAKERLAGMKDGDANAKKKDYVSLQMIDLETALDAGEVPEGSGAFLAKVIKQNPNSSQAQQARQLQVKIQDVRAQKAKTLLDEARRLFDEKKYAEAGDILSELRQSYQDVSETASMDALQKSLDGKMAR
jgi:tetratricopeptide (TPR) repeat protein